MCDLKEKGHDPEKCSQCQIDKTHAKLIELARQRKVTDKAKRTALTVLQKHLES